MRRAPWPVALLALLGLVGCRSDDDRPSDLTLAIYKRTPDADRPGQTCWLKLTSTDVDPKLVEGLGLCSGTADAAAQVLVRGADQLQVVADYDELEFDETTKPAAPQAVIGIDGVTQQLGVTFEAIAFGNRRGFRGPLTVPATAGDRMSIAVTAVLGYASPVLVYLLQAAEPALEVEGCAAGGCTRTGAVGDAIVRVRIPARSARAATLRSKLGPSLLPEVIPLQLAIDRNGTFEGVTPLAVPPASGTTWVIVATVDDRAVDGPPIMLDRPAVKAQLLCGASCSPGATTRSGVTITAPKAIRPATATVTILVDGAPVVLAATKALTDDNASAGTISGTFEFTVPDRPTAQLRVDASVAGFPADTLSTTIGPRP